MTLPQLLAALADIPGKVEATLAGFRTDGAKLSALTQERDTLAARVTALEADLTARTETEASLQSAKAAAEKAATDAAAEVATLKSQAKTAETRAAELLATAGHPSPVSLGAKPETKAALTPREALAAKFNQTLTK